MPERKKKTIRRKTRKRAQNKATKKTQKKSTKSPRKKIPTLIIGRAELAHLMGLTPSMISKLLAEGLPAKRAGHKGRRSEYDAIRVMAWWRTRQAETEASARDEYYQAMTEKVRQEIRQREGELVDVHEAEARSAERTLAARARLLELPATAVQRGIPEQYAQHIEDLVYDALSELAERANVES